jgi:hypothetical protein
MIVLFYVRSGEFLSKYVAAVRYFTDPEARTLNTVGLLSLDWARNRLSKRGSHSHILHNRCQVKNKSMSLAQCVEEIIQPD